MSAHRKRETITVDIPGLRELIDDASHGHPGPWVRTLIEDALQAPKRPSTRFSTRRSRTDGAKVTLFLLAHEHEALINGALSEHLSQNEYAGRLIAAGAAGAAFTGHDALQQLGQSNQQLVRIGTSLNRIGRMLETSAQDRNAALNDRDRQLLLHAARSALNHVELVAALVDRLGLTRRQAARRRRHNHGPDQRER